MLYNIIIFMKNKLAKIKTTFDEDGSNYNSLYRYRSWGVSEHSKGSIRSVN